MAESDNLGALPFFCCWPRRPEDETRELCLSGFRDLPFSWAGITPLRLAKIEIRLRGSLPEALVLLAVWKKFWNCWVLAAPER